jgi:hypothetical protein
MKKYQVYKDTKWVTEFDEVIPLYAFLKENIKDPENFNSMVLAKELVIPGDILFRAKDPNYQYIIIKIMEEVQC